jgi:hypothetical protein
MIIVLLVVLGIAVLAGAIWWIVQPRVDAHAPEPDARLPLFSSHATDGLRPPAQHHISAEPPPEVAMLRRGRTEGTLPPRQALPGEVSVNGANGASPADSRAPTAPHAAIPPDAEPPADASRPGTAGTTAAASAVPAAVPAVGTMQFLPGRLEVLQGRGIAEQEVRFVRPMRSGQAPEVTFGRGEGPPFSHVQLRAPTVSRLHARLVQQANGAWALENLSATNPVVVNGEELQRGAPPRPLRDGDRLEMGEVVFRYHER